MQHTHYHGDKVRSLLLTAGVVMALTLPFFTDLIPQPIFLSILAVLVLVLVSGWISPRYKGLMAISVLVSATAFVIFEYYAVISLQDFGFGSPFFLINQVLALVFLLSTYFATKSTRWLTQKDE